MLSVINFVTETPCCQGLVWHTIWLLVTYLLGSGQALESEPWMGSYTQRRVFPGAEAVAAG
jgi:hypothetical protein